MKLKGLSPAVLALLLASPFAGAQTAPAAPAAPTVAAAPSATAVDPKSIQALKDMGAHLQSLNRFTVSARICATTTPSGKATLTGRSGSRPMGNPCHASWSSRTVPTTRAHNRFR